MLHANQPGKLHRYYYNRHQAHGRDRGAGHPLPKGRAEAGVLADWQAQHRPTRCSLQACPLQAMAPWKLLQATQTTSVLSYTVSQHATIN